MEIISRDNSLLRLARAARDGKADDLIFIEGLRLCEEALSSKLKVKAVIYSEEIAEKERAANFLERVSALKPRMGSVSEKLLASVSYTKTPQGVIVLAERPPSGSDLLATRTPALLVVMHGINNPVNVGAIIRTAEAAGATGVIATARTSDPFSPKALRGAMGSAFRLPIWLSPHFDDMLAWCQKHSITTVAADLRASRMFDQIDWKQPSALVMGPEAIGLTSEEFSALADAVKIPMQGEVESLNVGVAAAVVLFEAARQRSR